MWCSDVLQFHPLSRQLLGTIEDAGEFRVTPATTKLVQDWDSVYDVYASRDWLRSLDALEAFADQHPDDVLAGIYLDRAVGFLLEPPPRAGMESFASAKNSASSCNGRKEIHYTDDIR